MRRSDTLLPLSRDHHRALVIAKRILALAAHQSDELEAYCNQVREGFAAELEQHFREEEQMFGLSLPPDYGERFHADHAALRAWLQNGGAADAEQFALCLKAHVRFEERELFAWLQQQQAEGGSEG